MDQLKPQILSPLPTPPARQSATPVTSTMGDRLYQIAALTAGFFLLATML